MGKKMEVDLSFCDMRGTRVHENNLIYDGMVPIPAVDENVLIEGKEYKVKRRAFTYTGGGEGLPDVQVTFHCVEFGK